jgi:uncharacterized protein YbjT (DUF2867 family)
LARALLVGCGCRGRLLARQLAGQGWAVRGTTRREDRRPEIEAAGAEAAIADPDRPGTVLDLVADITVVFWLLGSALGDPELLAAIHGPRLERLLEKLVDTPVRGFVYEAAGAVPQRQLETGRGIVEAAARTWRIPVEMIATEPTDHDRWLDAAAAATDRVLGKARRATSGG